jgi:hypothetical protein
MIVGTHRKMKKKETTSGLITGLVVDGTLKSAKLVAFVKPQNWR